MTISIEIYRTDKWIATQRLKRGENVPSSISVDVDPYDLSTTARGILLAVGHGTYGQVGTIHYNSAYNITGGSGFGRVQIVVDSDAPTTSEIDAAIQAAMREIVDGKAEDKQRCDEANAKRNAECLRNELRQAKITEARELLSGLIEGLESEKAAREADVEVLSRLIANVPQDALRGAARSIIQCEEAGLLEEFHDRVEQATMTSVFPCDDEAEEEDV